MALCSMTGFGQAVVEHGNYRLKVEIRSVNHRFAEFSIRAPRDWLAVEEPVRALLKQRIARGRLDVFITVEETAVAPRPVMVDWSMFDRLCDIEREAWERQGVAEKPPSVLTWLTYPNVLQSMPVPVDVDGLQEGILDAVSQACEMLVAMRGREGARMGADLSAKANALEERIAQMEQLADRLHHELHDKLLRRLRDLVDAVDESRLLTEVALLAERSTVDEELVRLRSHLSEFMSLLAAGSPVGRRLDFIVQEMHREVNTIGSKATDARLSSLVIDAKTLVEQLREQVQNIE